MLYRNPATRLAWKFWGTAELHAEGELRDAVMARTVQLELDRDPERKGMALVIDRVTQLGKPGSQPLPLLRQPEADLRRSRVCPTCRFVRCAQFGRVEVELARTAEDGIAVGQRHGPGNPNGSAATHQKCPVARLRVLDREPSAHGNDASVVPADRCVLRERQLVLR